MATVVVASEIAQAWTASLSALSAQASSSTSLLLDVARAKVALRRYLLEAPSEVDETSIIHLASPAQHGLHFLTSNGLQSEAYITLKEAAQERILRDSDPIYQNLEETRMLGVTESFDTLAAQLQHLRTLLNAVGSMQTSPLTQSNLTALTGDTHLLALRQRPFVLKILREWIQVAFSAQIQWPRRDQTLLLRTQRNLAELGLADIVRLGVERAAANVLRDQTYRILGSHDVDEQSGSPLTDAVGSVSTFTESPPAEEHMGDLTGDLENTNAEEEAAHSFDPEIETRPIIVEQIIPQLVQTKLAWCTATGQGTLNKPEGWQDRFVFYMDTLIVTIRGSQLFDLITDWPSSTPALTDLKVSLEKTQMKLSVSSQLQAALEKRLLHQGARTRDILQLYVSLVYAVRFIDPSGVILSRIAGPLRRYLRSRPDTVPVIVASLLGDDEAFIHLRGELDAAGRNEVGGASNQADTSMGTGERDEEEEEEQRLLGDGVLSLTAPPAPKVVDYQDPNWEPQPVDAGPSYKQTRSADVIAMLVSIFDDKASFVKALEVSTARALLKSEGYEVTREYRNNEVLKRRFGDSSLAKCDVMLQDVIDSRRVDSSVRQLLSTPLHHLTSPTKKKLPTDPATSGLSEEFRALKPIITSRHFWPDLEGSDVMQNAPTGVSGSDKPVSLASIGPPPGGLDLKLPLQMGKAMEDYNKTFTALRDSRRLRWLTGFGRVTVSVEMKDGRKWEEVVDPIRAGVLYLAGQVSERDDDDDDDDGPLLLLTTEVEKELNLPIGSREVQGAIEYWCRRNVLAPVEGRTGCFVECEMPHTK